MHILFFTPYFNQPRGNSTTVKRLVHMLQQQHIHTSILPYLEQDNWSMPEADITHVLHATRFVQWAQEHGVTLQSPYIVTMGGTDINVDLQKSMSLEVFTFLQKARYITVFTEDAQEKVGCLNPDWLEKTAVIPQGIWLPWRVSPVADRLPRHIVLPAGLRPVKDVLHAVPALEQLVCLYPDLQYTIVGSNLDQEVYTRVQAAAAERNWLRYAGVVPLEAMKIWYERAGIVLNTSISEGQSLALMEAMALGRPVIARKNAANVQLVQHGETGFLYETMAEFVQAVRMLVEDITLRKKMICQAQEWVDQDASATREADSYLSLYTSIL